MPVLWTRPRREEEPSGPFDELERGQQCDLPTEREVVGATVACREFAGMAAQSRREGGFRDLERQRGRSVRVDERLIQDMLFQFKSMVPSYGGETDIVLRSLADRFA
jgi:hypothetical protein